MVMKKQKLLFRPMIILNDFIGALNVIYLLKLHSPELKRISLEHLTFENDVLPCIDLKEIKLYYGRFSSHMEEFELNKGAYKVVFRDICEFAGTIRDPLKSLVKCCLIERNTENFARYCPDIVLYRYLESERIIDYHQPNPQGIALLKFEIVFASEIEKKSEYLTTASVSTTH